MPHFVYILECADGSFYVGYATDLDYRLQRHDEGRGGAYTAKRLPVRLVYREQSPNLIAALARERQLKRWTHAKKAALAAGDHRQLKVQAQSTRTKSSKR